MKKWYDEEYAFQIQVVGFLRGDKTEGYCRNGEEIGDQRVVVHNAKCIPFVSIPRSTHIVIHAPPILMFHRVRTL